MFYYRSERLLQALMAGRLQEHQIREEAGERLFWIRNDRSKQKNSVDCADWGGGGEPGEGMEREGFRKN